MKSLLTFLLLLAVFSSSAQKPVLKATRVTEPPKIDGTFDDEAWKVSPSVSMSITYSPDYGKTPTEKSEIHVVYDNTAIYIGAYLYDSEPSQIKSQLAERDGYALADNFAVGFDTYDDDLNGYRFIVSVAGVQIDQRITIQNNNDRTWDAVWQSATSLQADGWVAEIKIPYSAIRFPSKEIQNWGLQLTREIPRKGELDLWSPTDPKVAGIINQWGTLEGLENIKPPLRLSLSPYLTAGVQMTPVSYDPVEYVTDQVFGGGADVKWGINEAFTLDATLIPDFGQVQSDNLVLNISPFETKFDEKRPFFTEGVELFNQDNNNGGGFSQQLFYSRRIGGLPLGYYDVYNELEEGETIVSNPTTSKLYNATKLSGRTNGGLGIGVLNAVSRPTNAVIKNDETGETHEVETAPLTNYNVLVFDQSLKNNSKISFENTNTWREGSAADANVSSVHFRLRNKENALEASGFTNYSYRNDQDFGGGVQQGYSHLIDLSEIKGKFTASLWNQLVTPDYNQNDLGISFFSNEMATGFNFSYTNQELDSSSSFNLVNYWGGTNYKTRLEPIEYIEVESNAGIYLQKRNFFSFGSNLYAKPFWYYDYYEPRVEGRKFHHAPFLFWGLFMNSDYRKKFTVGANLGFGESPIKNDPFIEFGVYPALIVNDHFSFWYEIFSSHDNGSFGYVDMDASDEIIFGRRTTSTVANALGIKYAFNHKMNISFRGRYYWGKVVYTDYYELLESGDLGDTDFDGQGQYDINFNIFNIDALYTWEFAPGSFLNIIWKENISQSDNLGSDNYFENLSKTFSTAPANGLSVKLIYYLDFLSLKKKSAGAS
jgi:hypothetical protein